MAPTKPFTPWRPGRVDQVVRLWNAGLSAPDIALRLGLTRLSIESKIAKLRRAGVSLARRRSRAAMVAPYARRRCLHCDHPFDSAHIGNRICPICLIDGPYTSAMV